MRATVTVLAVFALVAAAVAAVAVRDPLGSMDAAMDRAMGEAISELEVRSAAARAPAAPVQPAASAAPTGERPSVAKLFTGDDVEAAKAGKKVYYQFSDASGNVRFVERWEQVPTAYRSRAGRIEMGGREPTQTAAAKRRKPQRSAATRPTKRPFAYTPEAEVVVYSAPWCGWCRKTLAHLDRKGVRYVNKDIDADKSNKDELVRKTGRTSIPVVEINGTLIRGHNPSRIDELLAQATSPAAKSPLQSFRGGGSGMRYPPRMLGIPPAHAPGLAAALLLVLATALTLPAQAQFGRRTLGETPIDDVLQVRLLDRELIALDALGGRGPRERLEIGENLLWTSSRGRVGVAVTDRRVLAVAVASGSWQAARYQAGELPPENAYLGDRVALLITAKRALGFDGQSGNLVEKRLGPHEQLLGFDVSANVAVVVTDRRALGLSPFAGGFFSKRVRSQERIEEINASGNLATVLTNRRLLTFRAPSGSWSEQNRDLY